MAIAAVLFDWDNTLVYAEPHQDDTALAALQEVGIRRTRAEVNRAFMAANVHFQPRERFPYFIAYVCQELGVSDRPEAVAAVALHVHEGYATRVKRLYGDVLPALRALRAQGLRVGIVSDNPRAGEQAVEFGLGDLVQVVVTPAEAGVKKPADAIYHLAVERIGVPAAQVLFVGDSLEMDVEGPQRCGMQALLLDRYELAGQGIQTLDELPARCRL